MLFTILILQLFISSIISIDKCNNMNIMSSKIINLDTQNLINKLLKTYHIGSWVQIGANTMADELKTNNPIMTVLDNIPHWNKYFMEPIPHNYERLLQNSKRWPNVTTIQAALSGNGGNYEGITTMYCLEGYHLENHAHHHNKITSQTHSADELCSFDEKHVLKHFPHGIITEVSVTILSMTVLLKMYQINDIKILVIDTEGFDAAVILALPFSIIRPLVIIFEHSHLTLQDNKLANDHLVKHCYLLFQELDNTYALHKNYLKYNTAENK